MIHNRKNKLFVFDIETIADIDAAKNLLGLSDISDVEILKKLKCYHLELTDGKSDFYKHPFHKVIAISFLVADISVQEDGTEYYQIEEIRSGGKENSPEEELVKGFFNYLSKLDARLVTFNGRSFDLPVLKYRAMLHGISARWLYNSGDRWNNYLHRHSLDWHCDLLEALTDFGASSKIKLHEVCAMLGLPGKIETDGSKVQTLFNENRINEIRSYCEQDVLNSYLLYLRYMLHRGCITHVNYGRCIEETIKYINQLSLEKNYLERFMIEWFQKTRLELPIQSA